MEIEGLLHSGDSELRALRGLAGGRPYGRRRPTKRKSGPRCTVYLDECGSYSLASPEAFPAFALGAAIIRDDEYQSIDQNWKEWKLRNLESADIVVHEPDARKRTGRFGSVSGEVFNSLEAELASLNFAAVVCVIRRPEYLLAYGANPPDKSLPTHPYLMALDFLMERIVMVLDRQFGGSVGATVIAESRGPKEDAVLALEFARLHLDGTSYISAHWFRQQLQPGMRFEGKQSNSTGLQLADLLVRPCAEKVIDPSCSPERWKAIRTKLAPGNETKHSILGLKIVPWKPEFDGLWES